MSVNLQFILDGVGIPEEAVNWHDISPTADYVEHDGSGGALGLVPQGQVDLGVTNLDFTLSACDQINNWINLGKIHHAMPFRVDACGITIFSGFLDLTAPETEIQCDFVKAKVKSITAPDFFEDKANSFRFEFLFTIGYIANSSFIRVPYIRNKKINPIEVGAIIASTVVVVKEIGESVKRLPPAVSNLINSIMSCIPINFFNLWILTQAILELAALLVYLYFMILLFIKLITDLLLLFFRPVKFKLGMYTRDILNAGASYLGYQFNSSIFFDSDSPFYNDVHLPAKHADGVTNDNKPFAVMDIDEILTPDTSYGYPDSTFGDFIRLQMMRFNAGIRITYLPTPTITLERRDYWNSFTGVNMPDIRERNADPHGTNASELYANYFLTLTADPTDENTIDEWVGTSASVNFQPTGVSQQNNMLKGSKAVTLPIAKGCRKEELTMAEIMVRDLYDFFIEFNTYLRIGFNVFHGGLEAWAVPWINDNLGVRLPTWPTVPDDAPNPVVSRVGCLLLTDDFFAIPKHFIVDPTTIHITPNSKYICSPATLMVNRYGYSSMTNMGWVGGFHSINFPVNIQGGHNQYYTYKGKTIPFCCSDFVQVTDNNMINTFNGSQAELMKLNYNLYDGTAKVDYRVKTKYMNDLTAQYTYDGFQ